MLDDRFLAPHAVARFAAKTPDAIALQHVDGRALTFGQLHREALVWANALAARGVGEGDHVGTLLNNTFAGHRSLLALGWLRAVEVPLNTAYIGRMLHYALDLADVTTLITTREFEERIEAVRGDLCKLREVVYVDDPGWAAGVEPADDLRGPKYRDIACLLFTSGTTGPSKAVITPWAVLYQNWSFVPDDTIGQGDGLYCPMSLFHNSGRGAFNYSMSRGARMVIRDKFSAAEVWKESIAFDCRALALVGPMTSFLWSAPPSPEDGSNPIRSVILGPMIPQMHEFEARFGVRVCTTYGQTEIGCPLTTGWDHGPWANSGVVRDDFPYFEVRVVDANDEPVPVGEVGEMIVRTGSPWGMNVGYYKMPVETAAAWRNGWFHTGDAFKQDDQGRFYFVDRRKDAIRRRGENISSFEVEAAIAEHPQVKESAAIGVPAQHGEDEVMAVLIVRDPSSFDPREFVAFLEPRMPKFMLPRYVEVVEELPRNATTGRVMKTELRARGVTENTWDSTR